MTTVTIDDSEEKIIERLGDCDKVPVDYMDLLSHRVRCRKIEIFHYDDEVSFTPNDEEEEHDLSTDQLFSEDRTDDEDRTMELVGEVDCLIRRIEQMQLIIKQRQREQLQPDTTGLYTETDVETASRTEARMPQLGVFEFKKCAELKPPEQQRDKGEQLAKRELPPPAADELNEGEPLSCEEQLEVRNLQHAHQRLQCEIDEMVCNYRLLRDLLANLRRQVCSENRRVRKLGEVAEEYRKWSQLVAQELPVCKQRYQRMLEMKLSKAEAKGVIRANIAKAHKYSKTLLTNRQLRYELREFRAEIDELMEYADDLRREMSRRFGSIERETGLTANSISQSN